MTSTKRINVLSYKSGSRSARELSRKLGVKRIRRKNSKFKSKPGNLIINCGTSVKNVPDHCHSRAADWINHPLAVSRAANKSACFSQLKRHGVLTVPWTDDIEEAETWIEDGKKVYCRTQLSGHSGAGIVIADCEEELVAAPLFTKYLNARAEYRVHVIDDKAVETRRKAKREGHEGNKYIRNHANGYVYRKHGIEVPTAVTKVAEAACKALSLDFCAVDILLYKDKAYVLEVNTAPGLYGSTVDVYADGIGAMLC